MQEIYVALKKGNGTFGEDGLYDQRWIADPNRIAAYLNAGWKVYRVNGLEIVKEVIIEIKMEQPDASTTSP